MKLKPTYQNIADFWGLKRYQIEKYKNGLKQSNGNIQEKNIKLYNLLKKEFLKESKNIANSDKNP